MKHKHIITLSIATILASSTCSLAQSIQQEAAKTPAKQVEKSQPKPKSKPYDAAQAKRNYEIRRVEQYLNSIDTLVSDFLQVAPDGSVASGKFYLKRPGKMRWQYEPPTPVLIIANDESLVYYDYELEQVTHLPIHTSLASILAREKVMLNDPELVIEEFTTSPGAVRIKIHKKGAKEEGSLLLEFADQPLRVKNIVVSDAQAQTTTISLNKARFGVPLERSLFVWQDPRKKRK